MRRKTLALAALPFLYAVPAPLTFAQENPALRDRLAAEVRAATPGAPKAFALFEINKGPWDRLRGDEPFIGSKKKSAGAGFYPEDMTKAEFEGGGRSEEH